MTGCPMPGCGQDPHLGLLCAHHGQRLADHYGAREGQGPPGREHHGLPWCWERLWTAYPSLAVSIGGTGSGPHDREAERLADVLALRDEIRLYLRDVAIELAQRINRVGPDTRCSHARQVHRAAAWLAVPPHLAALAAEHGITADGYHIAGVLDQADTLAERAHALAPWRPAPQRHRNLPCRCGAVGTVIDTDTGRRCFRCGRGYSDDEWRVLTIVLARRFSMDQSA